MNKFVVTAFVILLITGCATKKEVAKIEHLYGATDSVQYELIITEPGYDSWAATNRKPDWYHEKSYYRNWNLIYVTEFNNRVLFSGIGHPYNERINYDPQIDYGVEIEFGLYWYFKFIEYKYNTRLHISSR